MKRLLIAIFFLAGAFLAPATTLNMVSIYQPLSLHGTDSDDAADSGEVLPAKVMPTPMVLTGSFPETLVEAISQPHKIPTNNPLYKTPEANLLVLCQIGITAELSEGGGGTRVIFDVSKLAIPPGVDLTGRQVMKLAIMAARKTLEDYQKHQTTELTVSIQISGADKDKAGLLDLESKMQLEAGVN